MEKLVVYILLVCGISTVSSRTRGSTQNLDGLICDLIKDGDVEGPDDDPVYVLNLTINQDNVLGFSKSLGRREIVNYEQEHYLQSRVNYEQEHYLQTRDYSLVTPQEGYTCHNDKDAPFNQSLKNASLYTHNLLRDWHGVPHLIWDDDLAAHAQNHSDWMACNKLLQHSSTSWYGENIGFLAVNKKVIVGVSMFLIPMYNEISKYNFTSHTGNGTGHFTQMVWKSTEKVGCATTTVPGGEQWQHTYMVCQYTPPGNSGPLHYLNVLQPNVTVQATVEEVDIDGGCDFWKRCWKFRTRDCYYAAELICHYSCNGGHT